MASVLNVFEPKSKILASEVNENFELVQTDISEMGQTLNRYVEGEITSVQSNLSSVQATLQENINSVKATADAVYTNIAPDFSAGYSVSIGWTATTTGWLRYQLSSSANYIQTLYINSKVVAQNWQLSGDGRAGSMRIQGMVFIQKGATTSGQADNMTFYPCKGVQ